MVVPPSVTLILLEVIFNHRIVLMRCRPLAGNLYSTESKRLFWFLNKIYCHFAHCLADNPTVGAQKKITTFPIRKNCSSSCKVANVKNTDLISINMAATERLIAQLLNEMKIKINWYPSSRHIKYVNLKQTSIPRCCKLERKSECYCRGNRNVSHLAKC